MFCPKCGKEQRDGARFCPGCGAENKGASAVLEGGTEAETEAIQPAGNVAHDVLPSTSSNTGTKRISKWSLTWSRTCTSLEAYVGRGSYREYFIRHLRLCGLTEPQIQQIMQMADDQRMEVIGRVRESGKMLNWAKNQVGANSSDLHSRVVPILRRVREFAGIK